MPGHAIEYMKGSSLGGALPFGERPVTPASLVSYAVLQ